MKIKHDRSHVRVNIICCYTIFVCSVPTLFSQVCDLGICCEKSTLSSVILVRVLTSFNQLSYIDPRCCHNSPCGHDSHLSSVNCDLYSRLLNLYWSICIFDGENFAIHAVVTMCWGWSNSDRSHFMRPLSAFC